MLKMDLSLGCVKHICEFLYTYVPNNQKVFPPGYRFLPYDHEVLVGYLKPKASNRRFPQGVIYDPQLNIYQYHPDTLVGTSYA